MEPKEISLSIMVRIWTRNAQSYDSVQFITNKKYNLLFYWRHKLTR
jgi:hypothetical protein